MTHRTQTVAARTERVTPAAWLCQSEQRVCFAGRSRFVATSFLAFTAVAEIRTGDEKFVHARIWAKLDGTSELHSAEGNKAASDEL